MFRLPVLLAAFGLAFNLLLWSVPAIVGASGLNHALFGGAVPSLADALARAPHSAGLTLSLPAALTGLVDAESEALQVAALGLQQPTSADLAPRANAAGARVHAAVATYIRSAQAVLERLPNH